MFMEIKKVVMPQDNFPTKWQTVIFRNYGLVHSKRIAMTLGTDEATVEKEAQRLGIGNTPYDPEWMRSGYITVIRNNWYLLPEDQLLTLLDFSLKRLDFVLKEEDFLSVKLGFYKPECEPIYYSPLTDEQIEETGRIAAVMNGYNVPPKSSPFDFQLLQLRLHPNIHESLYCKVTGQPLKQRARLVMVYA